MRQLNLGHLAGCIALMFLAGCGGSGSDREETAKVTGVVTVGGKPVEGATVNFHPEKSRVATGTTDAEGKFSLTTYQTDDGAVPGTHKVSITHPGDAEAAESNDPESLAKAAEAKNPIPEKYHDAETSDLTREVEAGKDNHFEFKLD